MDLMEQNWSWKGDQISTHYLTCLACWEHHITGIDAEGMVACQCGFTYPGTVEWLDHLIVETEQTVERLRRLDDELIREQQERLRRVP